ncbi:hypothetical protein BDQ12DRAFT_249962 [Crucibulum laeve]|uniref:Cyclin-like domain-containing protein n=1 Tax=Crucibulum laeve TaxID=68775 RepID=A0A5C3LTZ2_9AGAR|nr:hypothetical protein BDQ12DRAFT_249962 [Crucibulum laeve]
MFSSPASSSSSTRSSPVHHASLVDPATHSPALLELIDIKMSRPVLEYVVDCVAETVDYAMGRPTPSSSSRGRSATRRPEHSKFTTFVNNVITRAEITTPTVLAALVYIDRAKPHLHIALEEWALERVFLGAIIVASKYLNDSTLKNVHWALCTGVFGKRDVGRIEREFLDVLDFELGITEADILSHHQGVISAAFPSSYHLRPQPQHFTAPAVSPVAVPLSPSAQLPELEHEHTSSGSSSGSMSPQTPYILDSPMYPPSEETKYQPMEEVKQEPTVTSSIPIVVAPPTAKKHSSFHASTLELLRSFPLPLHQHSARSHKKHQREQERDVHHLPIRLSA